MNISMHKRERVIICTYCKDRVNTNTINKDLVPMCMSSVREKKEKRRMLTNTCSSSHYVVFTRRTLIWEVYLLIKQHLNLVY